MPKPPAAKSAPLGDTAIAATPLDVAPAPSADHEVPFQARDVRGARGARSEEGAADHHVAASAPPRSRAPVRSCRSRGRTMPSCSIARRGRRSPPPAAWNSPPTIRSPFGAIASVRAVGEAGAERGPRLRARIERRDVARGSVPRCANEPATEARLSGPAPSGSTSSLRRRCRDAREAIALTPGGRAPQLRRSRGRTSRRRRRGSLANERADGFEVDRFIEIDAGSGRGSAVRAPSSACSAARCRTPGDRSSWQRLRPARPAIAARAGWSTSLPARHGPRVRDDRQRVVLAHRASVLVTGSVVSKATADSFDAWYSATRYRSSSSRRRRASYLALAAIRTT